MSISSITKIRACSKGAQCNSFVCKLKQFHLTSVVDTIFIIKVALGSTGVLASLLVVLLIGVVKLYKQFVYRLVLYLMAINALQALFQILELIPIEVTEDNNIVLLRNGTGWEEACSVISCLDIGVVWMGNLVIVWTMLYMLSLSWQLHRLQ